MVDWLQNASLTASNTFGFEVVAERYAEVSDAAQIPSLLAIIEQQNWPLLILGGGSNLVLSSKLPGCVLRIALRGYDVLEDHVDHVIIRVAAGEEWHQCVTHCLQNGWYGLENLALIPGSVGAAPVQNIGAYGVELKDVVSKVDVYDRRAKQFDSLSVEQCHFGYRDSVFKSIHPDRYLITHVCFKLSKVPRVSVAYAALESACRHLYPNAASYSPRQVFDAVCYVRRSKLPDPSKLGNAGSFFKNPVVSSDVFFELKEAYPELVAYPDVQGYKLAAGWMIDYLGWKGRRIESVGVHKDQALVLVNHGGGSRESIESLSAQIQTDVMKCFRVFLEVEPRFYP
ncbi:UDP-N-acetylmuramate dehydrogenase [Nitrincola nitratireducens]|uniref:UDP-N-acetylenolpyruvoylglucosamine reductase n=1 Tax=Nitrincola nitratireducens TaxID=1229521 RepID=W9V2N9_9GAMM|nr:UDP-N-acetylmuramate dehydrogenase [Nitrincola nitratireducens]EXJ11211.1 UDP-N-acetylenolpyruvoylglucosamine reductase [Nitrincola nitratireducens]